jgi:hypothetical protein
MVGRPENDGHGRVREDKEEYGSRLQSKGVRRRWTEWSEARHRQGETLFVRLPVCLVGGGYR